jgi:hypothetical protein
MKLYFGLFAFVGYSSSEQGVIFIGIFLIVPISFAKSNQLIPSFHEFER